MAVSRLARTYRAVGDLTYAGEVVEGFLHREDRRPVDPGVMAELQAVLISIYFERGDVMRAERAARRALAAADEGAPPEIRANVYWDASRVMAENKQWDEAMEFATRARVLMEELDDRRSVARLHTNYAFLCLESEPPRIPEAGEHLDVAEDWLRRAGAARELAYVYSERSRLALLEEKPEEAVKYADLAMGGAGQDGLAAIGRPVREARGPPAAGLGVARAGRARPGARGRGVRGGGPTGRAGGARPPPVEGVVGSSSNGRSLLSVALSHPRAKLGPEAMTHA